MKLELILEDKDSLILEDAFQNGVINEGLMDIVNTAVEAVFGTVGLIPVIGDIVGDLPMVVKNLVQKDYFGASIFFISMIPEAGDTAKTLRVIQKTAQLTGQEKRVNRLLEWLYKKTPQGQLMEFVMGMFDKAKNAFVGNVDKKVKEAQSNPKVKKHGDVLDKTSKFVIKCVDKMEKALKDFVAAVDKKHQSMVEPVGGADVPESYVSDLADEIKAKYHEFMKVEPRQAITYKNKVLNNAKRKPDVKAAYELVFGPISEI